MAQADADVASESPGLNTRTSIHCSNPSGRNQYKECPSRDDPQIAALLNEYQRRNITDRKEISKLLYAEHGIKMSSSTIARRRRELGLKGSILTTRELPDAEKSQLVQDQMAKDPKRRYGPRKIRELITTETGHQLTRDWIAAEMRRLDPNGFEERHPHKINTSPVEAMGPHREWVCDSHDKMATLGFPVWGIRDVWSSKWLGLWVVPPRHPKLGYAYMYLGLVKRLGGMPLQVPIDPTKDTAHTMSSFAAALRETTVADSRSTELRVRRFSHCIESATFARGSLRLRSTWGQDIVAAWETGSGIYNALNPHHYSLTQWLWPTLIQKELDKMMDIHNNHRPRKDHKKIVPSGVAPNILFALPKDYNGVNCLQHVDPDIVDELMVGLGGNDSVRFVGAQYAFRAHQVFSLLQSEFGELTVQNMWHIFSAMLPLMIQP
ncbi:hypothetical protein B0H21DRAFT_478190 [Amylocystis lapponica]|nr:hypothetical protein B0H21DRAFT_478190 [Amylocystis lapponica]